MVFCISLDELFVDSFKGQGFFLCVCESYVYRMSYKLLKQVYEACLCWTVFFPS